MTLTFQKYRRTNACHRHPGIICWRRSFSHLFYFSKYQSSMFNSISVIFHFLLIVVIILHRYYGTYVKNIIQDVWKVGLWYNIGRFLVLCPTQAPSSPTVCIKIITWRKYDQLLLKGKNVGGPVLECKLIHGRLYRT